MPSICPEASWLGSATVDQGEGSELSDDEPAFKVSITETGTPHSAALATVP